MSPSSLRHQSSLVKDEKDGEGEREMSGLREQVSLSA